MTNKQMPQFIGLLSCGTFVLLKETEHLGRDAKPSAAVVVQQPGQRDVWP